MSKSRKILVIVLFSILAFLIIVAIMLGVYVMSLYNKMNISDGQKPVDDVVSVALQRLDDGATFEEAIAGLELSDDQIAEIKQYIDISGYQSEYTGTNPEATDPITPDVSVVIPPPSTEPDKSNLSGVINILFLGTDERPGETRARSDSMIVVSINADTKEITFTSLMRDIYINRYAKVVNDDGSVEFVKKGQSKLNSAYFTGGLDMLNATLERNLGIQTQNFVQIDFDNFKQMIDKFGGIDVTFNDIEGVRKDEIKRLKRYTDFKEDQLVAGTEYTYHLDGNQALYYCRDRYSGQNVNGYKGGDFGRTERQRSVLKSMFERAQSMSLLELKSSVETVLEYVTTDLSLTDCWDLLSAVGTSYSEYKIKNYRIPADKTWEYGSVNGADVLQVNYEKNALQWREFVYGK